MVSGMKLLVGKVTYLSYKNIFYLVTIIWSTKVLADESKVETFFY